MLPARRKTAKTANAPLRWNRAVLSLGTQGAILAAAATSVAVIAFHVNGRMAPDPVLQQLTVTATRAATAKTETYLVAALKTKQAGSAAVAPSVDAPALALPAATTEPVHVAALWLSPVPALPPSAALAPAAPAHPAPAVTAPLPVDRPADPTPMVTAALPPPAPEFPSQPSDLAISAVPSMTAAISATPVAVAAAMSILVSPPAAGPAPSQALPVADWPNSVFEADRLRQQKAEAEALAAERVRRLGEERRVTEIAEARARAAERVQAEARVQARLEDIARKAAARRGDEKREASEKREATEQARKRAEEKSRVAAVAERRERAEAEERASTKRADAAKSAQRERFAAALAERERSAAPKKTAGVQIALNTKCAAMPLTRNWIGGVMFRSGYRSC